MLIHTAASSRHEARAQFRAGVAACFPTIPGYWSIGFAAGAIGTLSGFTTLQTALLATPGRHSFFSIRCGQRARKSRRWC